MMKQVYNPGRLVKLVLKGENIEIPRKESVALDTSVAEHLQELLPGLEYTDITEKEAKELEKKDVKEGKEEKKEKKPRKVKDLKKKNITKAKKLTKKKK